METSVTEPEDMENEDLNSEADDLLEKLFQEVQRPIFEWHTVAAIALFHTQFCTTCCDTHKFFMGWYAEQMHRTDKFARRLVKGRPVEPLPARVEEHNTGNVELCAFCVEIDKSVGSIKI